MESPSSVDLSDENILGILWAIKVYRQWVPCGCNSSYIFPPIVLKDCRCFQHGMKMCMWFWYNWLFFSLFLLCELSLFLVWNTIKVYKQCVPCGHNSSYSFPSIVLKLCRCFRHGIKICVWFEYNTLIIFSHFFCFVNLVSFFTWNTIEV